VAAPGVVVTNAHVVAGENDTRVEVGGNAPGFSARAIDFDPHNDIAILRVPGLPARPLALAPVSPSGTAVAILGYPEDGPFDAEPGRIGQTVEIDTEDAYGNGPVLRSVTEFLGRVRPGNSGGPLVDGSGHVVATVFAALTSASGHGAGFAVPDALVRHQLQAAEARGADVSTGPCAG
jgi:S1-C subfamily serine protease